jgi:hypothetical protein
MIQSEVDSPTMPLAARTSCRLAVQHARSPSSHWMMSVIKSVHNLTAPLTEFSRYAGKVKRLGDFRGLAHNIMSPSEHILLRRHSAFRFDPIILIVEQLALGWVVYGGAISFQTGDSYRRFCRELFTPNSPVSVQPAPCRCAGSSARCGYPI